MDQKLEAAVLELEELGLDSEAWFLRGVWDAFTGIPGREVVRPIGETMSVHRTRAQRRKAYEAGRSAGDAFDAPGRG